MADWNLSTTFSALGVACALVTIFSRVEEEMLID
jgi:hypothetical protein